MHNSGSLHEPHALRLACLPLCEKPERSVNVQVGARHPHQQGVGIVNEARPTICASASVVLNGTPVVRTSPIGSDAISASVCYRVESGRLMLPARAR
jgi:hypothetical protein